MILRRTINWSVRRPPRDRTFLTKIAPRRLARRAEGRPLDFLPIREIGDRRTTRACDGFIVARNDENI